MTSVRSPHTTAGPLRPAPRLAVLALALTLSGCSSLLGGGSGDRERSTIYAPDPRVETDAAWPRADWQLTMSP
ncbi:hypothetical protein, partial [Bacillus sp. SIMBA_005]